MSLLGSNGFIIFELPFDLQDFKLKADNAGKVMDTSTGAMRLATDELKGVSADAEASADPTKEAKGGGRKGRGKKATKSASADKPGEEVTKRLSPFGLLPHTTVVIRPLRVIQLAQYICVVYDGY